MEFFKIKKRGNVLTVTFLLCILLIFITSIVCSYSLKILAQNGEIQEMNDERLKRERLESEIKGRVLYAFSSDEDEVEKIEYMELVISEIGFELINIVRRENGGINLSFHDRGKRSFNIELSFFLDKKIDELQIDIINF